MSTEKLIISSKTIKSLYNAIKDNKFVAYQGESMTIATQLSAQNITAAHCHCLDTGDEEVEFLQKEGQTSYCPCVIGSTCWPQCRDW